MSDAAAVYDYFRQRGLSPAADAGIVGNTQQESSNNAAAPGGGLDQGQGDRAHGGSLKQQLDAIWGELQGPERGTLRALQGAQTPAQAALIFSKLFERPGEPMNANRVRYAQDALKEFGNGQAAGASAALGGSAPASASGGGEPDLTALISALRGSQRPSTSVEGLSLPKPTEGVQQGPHAPRELPVAQEQSPADLLSLLSQVTQEAAAPSSEAAKSAAAPAQASSGAMAKGLAHFDDKPVAAWIAPILAYAQAHGWKGSVESGYRSKAEQERIYNSGVRPAAVPGTSNHEGTEFPRGAVDVSEAQQLSSILQHSPYAKALVYAGSKDPVHFSHPHDGGY